VRQFIFGMTPATLTMDDRRIQQGRYISELDLRTRAPVAVLGSRIAEELFGGDDPIGKEIRLVNDVKPGPPNRYIVVGVLEPKVYRRREESRNWLEWMNEQVHIPLTAAHARETGNEQVGSIQVKAASLEVFAETKTAIQKAISARRRGQDDWTILDRAERLAQWRQRSLVYEVAVGAAGAVSLLVGGIVIMNILLASLAQRVREVGLRKALGAKDSEIFFQFLVESVLVASLGGAGGVLLGVVTAGTVSGLIETTVRVTAPVVVTGLVVAVGTGLAFGIYPGFRAARLAPVEALRHE
jgi:putative ABC transport system permease protein